MISHLKQLDIDTTPKTLRSFGLLLSLILFGFVAYQLVQHDHIYRGVLFAAGFIASVSLIFPAFLKCVYIPWMIIARLIGFIITQVILTLFYFIVITPIGLIKKFTGLFKKSVDNPKSYWIKKEITQPDMKRMF